MAKGGIYAWGKDDQGNDVMPELQADFLDWLLSDIRVPSSQALWAEEHGVNEKTVGRWKRDERFRKAWDRAAAEKNVGTERVQDVIEVIYKAAVGGDIKAAEMYMRYVDRILPPTKVERVADDLEAMSDEELAALAAEMASAES